MQYGVLSTVNQSLIYWLKNNPTGIQVKSPSLFVRYLTSIVRGVTKMRWFSITGQGKHGITILMEQVEIDSANQPINQSAVSRVNPKFVVL